MTDIALLPCPYCGGKEHEIGVGDDGHSITCHSFSCRASTGVWHTREQAIAAWNRRASPSQVAPQPQAGEAVAWRYKLYVADVDWTVSTTKPKGAIVEPLYAAPQPANPAQVTEAMVEAAAKALYKNAGYTAWCALGDMYKNAYRDRAKVALTAAIGAGGQAVAWLGEGDGFKSFTRSETTANKWRKGGIKVTAVSALSQPHPADERVVEALRIAEERLSSLLARIHRDGGHYEADHGTSKAAADADTIVANLYALSAENTRLRALPLKDEVERVVDDAQTWISENVRPSDAVGNEILCEIRALLSRIRAGVQEGKQRFAVQSPTGAHVGLWETKAFADKIAKDEGPGYVVIELIEIAASPSVSDGGSRNG